MFIFFPRTDQDWVHWEQQLCSGIDKNAVGVCSQLVFAPVDVTLSDDDPLLPSGFCVIPLDCHIVVSIFSNHTSFPLLNFNFFTFQGVQVYLLVQVQCNLNLDKVLSA
jgi:hypothetical protein